MIFFECEHGILYHGDCLEVMKQLEKVDMILTDPPYGMNFISNHRKSKYNEIYNDDNLDWLDEYVKNMYNTTNNNTAHYMFCSFHNIDVFKQKVEKYFTIKNILVWEKNNISMGDLKADFAPKVEFVIFFQKGRKMINGKRTPNIFKFDRTGNKLHPTQKPVDLIEHLIKKFSIENEVVLDPFCGSGTTAIAAINSKRKFICIEKEQKYCDIAVQRILRLNRQGSLL